MGNYQPVCLSVCLPNNLKSCGRSFIFYFSGNVYNETKTDDSIIAVFYKGFIYHGNEISHFVGVEPQWGYAIFECSCFQPGLGWCRDNDHNFVSSHMNVFLNCVLVITLKHRKQ